MSISLTYAILYRLGVNRYNNNIFKQKVITFFKIN